jgi:outer membrane protein assembly factor BamB
LRWGLDLVQEFGAQIPPWYTGQCPLVESNRVILAPGGPEALLVAAELDTGKVRWRTPNPRGWKMTHSSIVPVDFAGRRMLVYCASGGVVGVDAADGRILWDTDAWKISIATIPCPVDLGGGRIFLTGGYNAGSMLIQLQEDGAAFRPEIVYRLKPGVFGATQHSPIFSQGHLFGVRADGRFVCLEPGAGKVVWTSEPGSNFGLGAFMMAGDLIFALNDSGKLSLIAADPAGYKPLASAKILKGPESWGPLALVSGRLIARDLNQMVCLDVAAH